MRGFMRDSMPGSTGFAISTAGYWQAFSGGEFWLDGVDVRHYRQQELRKVIGVVLQDNVLFSGSVLDNLRLAAPEASDSALIAAVRELGADEVLERLPQGYRTEVGPLGGFLSHGQRPSSSQAVYRMFYPECEQQK